MQDKELFKQLLGLKGAWEVTEVKVDCEKVRVDIWVKWPSLEQVSCPECGKTYGVYDHREERQWRHLDTMQFQTILHCNIPRVKCTEHGVKSVEVSWSEERSRFTALFERFAIEVLQGCQNQTKAARILKLSWDEVHEIQERAVGRGLSRREEKEIPYVGIDEKSFLKRHSYATVVLDIKDARVIDVGKDRKEETVKGILAGIPEKQRAGIRAVAIDMWDPYIKAVESMLPDTDIVHDKFHIVKHLGEAVDKVRKTEHKDLSMSGDESLKGTKYLWLTNPKNWTDKQQELFRELKGERLKVGRAWALKDMFSELWEYTYEGSAKNFFKKWYWWATHARLKPLAKAAKMIKEHLPNILTYLKHRITNAVAEGINSKIQQIKSAARGFRNFYNYRTAILFHCGKLNMYPYKSL